MSKSNINDLEINLANSKTNRENKTIPSSWDLGKHTLEFLQKMKAIKYREAREVGRIFKELKGEEIDFLNILKKQLSPKVEYLRIHHFSGDDPLEHVGAFPMREMRIVEEKEYTQKINDKKTRISKAYITFIESLEKKFIIEKPLYKWLNESFKSGSLEKEINNYLQKEKNRLPKSLFPKLMLKKLAGQRDRPEEVLPTFTPAEMDVLHVSWYKSQNMNKKEISVLKRLDPNANSSSKSPFKVVIARSEALNMCYTEGSGDTSRRVKFFTAVESLTKKSVTWVLDKEAGGHILYQEPVIRTAFAYELSKEGIEEGRYFCVEIPRKLLDIMSKKYFKTQINDRLKLRSIPPRLSIVQDKFLLNLKIIAPINSKSKREFKWEARKWVKKLWGEDKKNFLRNLDTLEEFGKKQVLLYFFESFEKIEEGGEVFFRFKFPPYCKYS